MFDQISIGDIVTFTSSSPLYKHVGDIKFRVVDVEEQGGTDHDHAWLECVGVPDLTITGPVNTTELIRHGR